MTRSVGIDLGLARLSDLAPAGYALGLHIRFASAHIMVQTYDPRWIEIYTERGYLLCDPLVSWGFGTTGTARWSELNYPDPHDIFGQAAGFGLKYGVAVSIGPLSSRSIGGFARSDREFTEQEMEKIHETVEILHRESTPPSSLTIAQAMALRLIAKGCRHAEAAALLGISESALKARLRTARERLLSRTTAEAIQRAQEYKLL
ncbi:MAG: autoinducer binding domain-containing protein [Rhodobacteraceae bacterium]|nr:autoinducer binding domain-containing protein [Paracoccaceae bacterium]